MKTILIILSFLIWGGEDGFVSARKEEHVRVLRPLEQCERVTDLNKWIERVEMIARWIKWRELQFGAVKFCLCRGRILFCGIIVISLFSMLPVNICLLLEGSVCRRRVIAELSGCGIGF